MNRELVENDDEALIAKARALVGREFACPFCADGGFDSAGLKSHIINGDCSVCEKVEIIQRMRAW